MKEVHGVADVHVVGRGNPAGRMRVTVEDGAGWVYVRFSRDDVDGCLSPAEARMIARELVASAQRVEEAAREKA